MGTNPLRPAAIGQKYSSLYDRVKQDKNISGNPNASVSGFIPDFSGKFCKLERLEVA